MSDLRRSLMASLCRDSFADFCEQGWPVLEPNGRPLVRNPGTDALIEHLQAVGDGRIKRLAISIAPGFGKSTFASVAFPAWMWARRPAWRVICASYAQKLATDIAKRGRDVLASEWYRDTFGVELESDNIELIRNTQGGKRISGGVLGALTGFRADAAIIDDAVNAVDAYSAVELQKVNDWYDQALSNRLDRGDDAPIVVIGQRLAEADLLGYLAQRGGYQMLVLPSEFEVERRCVTYDRDGAQFWADPRTTEGDLLAPEIQSAAYLAEQRIVQGPYGYAAQYQQRPAPLEGGVLARAWWRWFRDPGGPLVATRPRGAAKTDAIELPDLRDIVISCDLGFKGGKDHDNTAMIVVGSLKADRFVLDLVAKPMEFLEQIAALKALRAKWPQARRVLIEDSANAASLMSTLQHEMQGLIPVPTGSDKKESRIMAHAPALHSGNVYLRDGAPWADDLIEEAAVFPAGRRDDRIDAWAQAMKHYDTSGVDRLRKLSSIGTALAGVIR